MCQPSKSSVSSSSSSSVKVAADDAHKASTTGVVSKAPVVLKSQQKRPLYVDVVCFLLPLLAFPLTPVWTVYLTGIVRMVSTHAFLSLHYLACDKDNYATKLSQKQLVREKKDYLVGIILHMWAQLALQVLFPGMFFSSDAPAAVSACAWRTFLTHVALVEPLYYAVHRWLHVPEQMKQMHGHHHMSVNTVPATSLVQNFTEHFIYIATFGPAMILPYFLGGAQHWAVILAYLVLFDVVNAYGHTNFTFCRHWVWESAWSPLRYLFYTPEFHLGHHHYYNCNYALFMPLWDHLFNTYREYRRSDVDLLPAAQQDFVFLGHNGGLGHLITIPELSMYNIYDPYLFVLPLKFEVLLVNAIFSLCRLFMDSYRVSRYLVANKYIGRVVCLVRSPLDYVRAHLYPTINKELLETIRREHRRHGTTSFGLGNCNKMKQLNDGGKVIVDMISADPELKDKNIRVWTGDTLTAASIYHQLMALPDLASHGVYYIGANGKIGSAVVQRLVKHGVKVTIFSTYQGFSHPLVSYSTDLSDMRACKYTLVGKLLKAATYKDALVVRPGDVHQHRYLLDYTVPFMPLRADTTRIHHVQVGVLAVAEPSLLKGYYDICFGIPQGHIYPCHMGCLINLIDGRTTDETGEVDFADMDSMWKRATALGLQNKPLEVILA